jgi:hypothetical protein
MMDHKELQIIKQIVRYSAKTGNFYRGGSDSPAKFANKNKHATISFRRGEINCTYPAWKIAIYMSHGYWPDDGDTCEYVDSNLNNLSLSNLRVIHFGDDETTVMDYCIDNQLEYRYVSLKMRKEKRIRRNVGGMSYWFYKKEDFERQCRSLKKIDVEQVKKPSIGRRKNQHFRDFLKTHMIVPKRWEMTLC